MTQTPQSKLVRLLHPSAISDGLASPIGRIAAGFPLEAIEDRQHNELLDLLTAHGLYALRVGDDDWINPACRM
jgi:SOS-response transcriptional repressor LexA